MIGSNLINWVNENYFEKTNVKEIHFYDNDVDRYKEIVNEIRKKNDGRRYAKLTKFKEMENYIKPSSNRRLFWR